MNILEHNSDTQRAVCHSSQYSRLAYFAPSQAGSTPPHDSLSIRHRTRRLGTSSPTPHIFLVLKGTGEASTCAARLNNTGSGSSESSFPLYRTALVTRSRSESERVARDVFARAAP